MIQTKDTYTKVLSLILVIVAFVAVIYHMVYVQYIFQSPVEHQIIHLLFVLTLVLLSTMLGLKKRKLLPLIILLLIGSWIVTSYMKINFGHLQEIPGMPNSTDVIIGIILIIVVIETTREAWGWVIPILTVIFLAYFFFGNLLPGAMGHTNFSPSYIVSVLGIGFSGIFQMLGLSADELFVLMLFSSVIQATGAMKFILEIAKWASKRLAGGPAHTCIIASGLFGTVSGSAMANVAMTGAFTIPLMKKAGYNPNTAGAIEATASCGGQIMPPVMGAVAFVMAGTLGVPYADVMLAAVIPALLYYFSVGMGVQIIALKEKMVIAKEPADIKIILRTAPVLLVPLAIIIGGLLMHFSISYVIFYATIVMLVIAVIQKETRPTWSGFVKSVTNGALTGAKMGVILACLGMIIETLYQTQLGIKLSFLVDQFSFGFLPLALIIAMIISIILGCAAPTVGAYILVAIVVSPLLVRLGASLFAAHFFALYFACFSTLTPPVALASITAASIAGGNQWKTGINAFKLALAGFIVPFVAIYNPSILLGQHNNLGETPFTAISLIIIMFVTMVTLLGMLYNHLFYPISKIERLLYGLCTLLGFIYIFTLSYIVLVMAILLFVGLISLQWRRRYALKKEAINAQPD